MRIALLLAVLAASGCASSRPSHPPGTLPIPTTLEQVNAVLADVPGTIYYTDDRPPDLAFIQIGPDQTLIRPVDAQANEHSEIVSTEGIRAIEIDDSQTAWNGAERGFELGVLPGLGIALAGLAVGTQCDEFGCGVGAAYMMAGGGLALVVGAIAGAATGAATTSRRYPVVVYEGPVTRYPDATARANSRPARSILELATSD